MKKKKEILMCEECFALIEECECEELKEDGDEEWEDVPSPYKAYKDGV